MVMRVFSKWGSLDKLMENSASKYVLGRSEGSRENRNGLSSHPRGL